MYQYSFLSCFHLTQRQPQYGLLSCFETEKIKFKVNSARKLQVFASDHVTTKRIFISTGELSGDLQGSILIRALKEEAVLRNIKLQLYGLGGQLMQQEGLELILNTSKISSIGLIEAIPFLWSSLLMKNRTLQHLILDPPDVAILIDYAGPNLEIAPRIRNIFPGIPMLYYIAPQEWVWGYNNQKVPSFLCYTTLIRQLCSKIYAVFPAEHDYYRQHGINSEYIGHPLFSSLKHTKLTRLEARKQLGIASNELVIALVPASRQQELKYILPVTLKAAKMIQQVLHGKQILFVIPCSRSDFKYAIQSQATQVGLSNFSIYDHSLSTVVIASADLCIMKSGTVNLEAVAWSVPQVVLYRLSDWTAWLAKHVLHLQVPFIAAPNCVEMQTVVPEFVQESATAEHIAETACKLLQDEKERQEMIRGYERISSLLYNPDSAGQAAKSILDIVFEQERIYSQRVLHKR
eukprot:jgi/Galph1/4028/GphlegSOOS_G2664.1